MVLTPDVNKAMSSSATSFIACSWFATDQADKAVSVFAEALEVVEKKTFG